MRSRGDAVWYRLFLALYPREFRRAHGRDLEELYHWSLEMSRQRRGWLPARLRGMADAIRGGFALRHQAPRPGRRWSMGSMGQDVRFAWRSFRRAPWFTAGAILVLSLGIGANGAIFSLVRAVLLEPLPYARPDEIVMVWHRRPDRPEPRVAVSTVIRTWRDTHGGALQDLAATRMWTGNLAARFDLLQAQGAERLRAGLVTPNFFSVLGATPLHGRVFSADDERAGRLDVVVLGHALWRRAFGGDPGIVGRTVQFVSGRANRVAKPYVVIGVLPPAFRYTYPLETEVWAILPWAEIDTDPGEAIQYDHVVARIAPGLDFAAARRRMAAVNPGYDRVATSPERRSRTYLQPIAEWVTGETRPTLILLGGVSVLLLVIACATVANGLLVQLAERQRELALRAALGAGRLRIVRQLLTEGVALAVAGTLAGCGLAMALLPAFRRLVPAVVPRADEMTVDVWILAFAAAGAAVVTVLAAVTPALYGSRRDVVTSLKTAAAGASASHGSVRWRRALVGMQAAVATSLLVGATLLLGSFWRLGRVDLGFQADGVWTVEMRLLERRYFAPEAMLALQRALVERVRVIPGVTDVALTSAVPFRGVDFLRSYDPPGCERGPAEPARPGCPESSIGGHYRSVDPAFFSIMQIPLRRGRLLQPSDTLASQKVVVVSESFGRLVFGSEDPVGRFLNAGELQIVGIVGDVRYEGFDREARGAVYHPRAQSPLELICLVVRTAPGTPPMATALRDAIHAVDPTIPAMDITTIDRILADSVADRRFYTATTSVFATLALLLIAAGLVVVIARSVVERRREMAIRAALGARAAQLVRLAAQQGVVPIAAGTAAGLTAAWLASALIEPFLFELTAHDWRIYAAAGAVTIIVGAVACLLPARRLTASAPAAVLRGE